MSPDNSQSETRAEGDEQSQTDEFQPELPHQYQILGKLSEGGMGAIYKVQNRYTGSNYAIKVLRPECANNQDILRRFVVEAKAASALKHPHICLVHDFGINEKKMPYLVMDWIDGVSLERKIKDDGPLTAAEAIPIFQQIAMALAHAHHNKVVHRDLKPANIMLCKATNSERLEVRLVDFGIAKVLTDEGDLLETQGLTRTGMVLGTPLYMSPEQARGKNIDHRSDIYSLGCVMYFALTGQPPFIGESFMDTIHKHMHQEIPEMAPVLKIPADLKMIVLKAMEKEPSDRYQTIEQMSTDLKKLTKGVGLEHRPLSAERQKLRARLVTIACFVLGFIVMYVASIAIQNLLNAVSPGHEAKHSAMPDSPVPSGQK